MRPLNLPRTQMGFIVLNLKLRIHGNQKKTQ